MKIPCDNCGTLFNKAPRHIKTSKRHFCSRKCRGLGQRVRVLKTCVVCGNQFEVQAAMSSSFVTCDKPECRATRKRSVANKRWEGRPQVRMADCHPDRKHLARGMCKSCYGAWYGDQNRDRRNAIARKWAKEHPEQIRATRRKYLYGITKEDADAKLRTQAGICPICEEPATHLDHDHVTGATRSFLCALCNKGLGHFRDKPILLRRAAEYLEKWGLQEREVAA